MVADKKAEQSDKARIAERWTVVESQLLDQAVKLYKHRCMREAEEQHCAATISFEALSREIDNFPKRVLKGSTYYVDNWGEGLSGEPWFYATRGSGASWSADAPVYCIRECSLPLPAFWFSSWSWLSLTQVDYRRAQAHALFSGTGE